MPSFDVVSEVDRQELRNAIDQAQRELANRYDFKDTNSEIEQKDLILTLRTSSEDRLRALKVLLEERFVKRNISLKSLDWGKIEQATGESVRQILTIKVGVPAEKAREINKLIGAKERDGYTMVATAMYWKGPWVKLEFYLAKGKREFDKRDDIKDRDWSREKERMMKHSKR